MISCSFLVGLGHPRVPWAVLAAVACLSGGAAPLIDQTQPRITLQATTAQTGRYQKLEFRLSVAGDYLNPFNPDEVDVSVQVTGGRDKTWSVPAFSCQEYERQRRGPPG